jgi:methylated-DNA-[protein]-cysteine S-methyltransferase
MSINRDQVYALLQQVPAGKVTTYKLLAEAVGTKGYRAIGAIVRDNPNPPAIPCHRVVSSNGKIGGFMGENNGSAIQKKKHILAREGVSCKHDSIVNFKQILHSFN